MWLQPQNACSVSQIMLFVEIKDAFGIAPIYLADK